jgi:hypothetical protein
MTRTKKLREVLNVRLDQPLAKEIRRIALDRGSTESEVARLLLSYGVEVQRRLDAQRFSRSYHADYSDRDEVGTVEIRARWVPGEEGS